MTIPALALIGCAGPGAPDEGGAGAPGAIVDELTAHGETLRVSAERPVGAELKVVELLEPPAFPEGYGREDFEEVAPGVFFLRDMIESGEIVFHSTRPPEGLSVPEARGPMEAPEKGALGSSPLQREEPRRDHRDDECGDGLCTVCDLEGFAEDAGVAEFVSKGVSFGWYDAVIVSHFSTDCCEPLSDTGIFVSLHSFADAPSALSNVAEIYVNGVFVGVMLGASPSANELTSTAFFSVADLTCEESLTVEVFPIHSFGHDGLAALISTFLEAELDCAECALAEEICL